MRLVHNLVQVLNEAVRSTSVHTKKRQHSGATSEFFHSQTSCQSSLVQRVTAALSTPKLPRHSCRAIHPLQGSLSHIAEHSSLTISITTKPEWAELSQVVSRQRFFIYHWRCQQGAEPAACWTRLASRRTGVHAQRATHELVTCPTKVGRFQRVHNVHVYILRSTWWGKCIKHWCH